MAEPRLFEMLFSIPDLEPDEEPRNTADIAWRSPQTWTFPDPHTSTDRKRTYQDHRQLRDSVFRRLPSTHKMRGSPLSPSPMLVPPVAMQAMKTVAQDLHIGLTSILREYSSNIELQSLIPCPKAVEHLSKIDMSNARIGSFLPELLITSSGDIAVSGIKPGLRLEEYLAAHGGAESIESGVAGRESLPVFSIPEHHNILSALSDDLLPRSAKNGKLWLVQGEEGSSSQDPSMLLCAFGRVKVNIVRPGDLHVNEEGRLMADSKGVADAVVLDLERGELLSLPKPVLSCLFELSFKGACVNPVWTTILFAGDCVMRALRSLSGMDIRCDAAVAERLRSFIVPTVECKSVFDTMALLKKIPDTSNLDFDMGSKELDEGAKYVSGSKIIQAVQDRPVIVRLHDGQEKFRVPTDPLLIEKEGQDSYIVGSLLCLNETLLGPGVFRAIPIESEGNANSPHLIVPGLPSPALPTSTFRSNGMATLDAERIKKALATCGSAVITFRGTDGAVGLPTVHLAEHLIKALSAVIACGITGVHEGQAPRGETLKPFDPHCDASWGAPLPRFVAQSTIQGETCGAVWQSSCRISDATHQLCPGDIQTLRKTEVKWCVPEDIRDCGTSDFVVCPVLASKMHGRMRKDVNDTSHLPVEERARFWSAFNNLHEVSERLCRSNVYLVPGNSFLILDNHKHVHASSLSEGGTAAMDGARLEDYRNDRSNEITPRFPRVPYRKLRNAILRILPCASPHLEKN